MTWSTYGAVTRMPPESRRWERDTIVPVASTTKGVTTLCAHMLVDRGLLDLDEPVATYWPEFAQQGKERVLVRHVLSHQAGLVTTDAPLSSEDYMDAGKVLRALERTRAQWEPGTMYAYHALTFGFLVAELVRRITGCSIGAFVRDEIAGPIGVDFYIGFGPEIDSRVAEFVVELPLIDFVSAPRGMLTAGSAESARVHASFTCDRAAVRQRTRHGPRTRFDLWRACSRGRDRRRPIARIADGDAVGDRTGCRAMGRGSVVEHERPLGARVDEQFDTAHGSESRGRSATWEGAALWRSPIPTRGWGLRTS